MSPILKEEIIVLEGFQTGNTSEVIHALSPGFGRLSIYVRGINRKSSPLRGILQPLSQVEVTLNMKQEGDMATLRDAALLKERGRLIVDLERFSLALLILEAGWLSTHPGQESRGIYHTVLEGLDALDPSSPISAPMAACRTFLFILAESGYIPNLDEELTTPWPSDKPRPTCFWLQLESGSIHHRGPQPREPIDWEHFHGNMRDSVPLPPEGVRSIWECLRGRPIPSLDSGHALATLDGLVRYLEFHQEGRLRSADFWRKIQGREK
ncbi:MAG: recombination protein O N-terminal domain-containing protein [Candidatus Sumerlaeia bacterium]|nr:recombination protein O N-terminal domain-containing protein [Candidatus Sumerlaeia bacterium]